VCKTQLNAGSETVVGEMSGGGVFVWVSLSAAGGTAFLPSVVITWFT